MARDDFRQLIKEALAKRAGYLCCKPDCQDPFTSLPHSDSEKAINLGVAAHIRAASEGGPRFDKNQEPKERQSIMNGIWLCQRCAHEIDTDIPRYPVSLIEAWKLEHETILASAPLRSKLFGNGLRKPSTSETTVAINLIHFLGDRRMLFEDHAWEVPREVLLSVQETRSVLVKFLSEIAASTPLHKAISALQDTYYTFLHHAGDLSSRYRLSERPWEEGERLRFALAALRKSCGFQIGDIAKAYKISIPQRLRHVCPS